MAPTGHTARQSPQNSQDSGWSPLATTWLKPPFFMNCSASIIKTSLQMLMHSRAGDAAVHVEVEHEAPRVFRNELLLGIGEVGDAMLKGHVLKLAMPVGIADGTVQRMD